MSKRKVKPDLPPFLQPLEPWPDPVDGAELLTTIRDALQRFMVLPDHAAETVALWVMFAHAHEAAEHSPILAIESPEKRCGKTTLLNIIGKLVPVALPAANITTASIFRAIERFAPTLLLDEVETYIRDNEEMRGVLNSGFTRDSAVVIRNVGESHEPQPFKTWCPKAGALIGKLPDTLQDRAIVVLLRRRLRAEHNERFTRRHHSEMQVLHRQAARWASDHLEALKDADPPMPRGLGDRAEDAWRPLLAIADQAEGAWPATARSAALALSGSNEDESDGSSKGVLLLTHFRKVFQDAGTASIPSMTLLDQLNGNEEWPWGEWRQGKPISPRGVAAILKPYNIRPRRGNAGSYYLRTDFEDAWQRYLAPAAVSASAPSATDREIACNVSQLKAAANTLRTATEGGRVALANEAQPIDTTDKVALVALDGGSKGKRAANGRADVEGF